MTDESWLEPRTRIPFAGIIAIVVIVAVVAVFIKWQLGPMFPASDIKVQSTATASKDSNALTGMATSDSFYGIKNIPLERKNYLQGYLSRSDGAKRFVVDTEGQMLTFTDNEVTEDIVLTRQDDKLLAIFEHNDGLARVDVTGQTLLYSLPGKSVGATPVPLSETISYDGTFTFRNTRYTIRFNPAKDAVVITSPQGSATVTVSAKEGMYVGTWTDGKAQRPITIDISESKVTIEELL